MAIALRNQNTQDLSPKRAELCLLCPFRAQNGSESLRRAMPYAI